jgi:hypothetical protein
MATEIGGHNMKVRLQCSSDLIPAAAVVAASMDEDQRRRCAITPIGIMQPQALGFVEAVCRTDQWRNHFIFGHLTPVRLAETGQLYCPHNSCKICNFTMTKSSQDEVFGIQTGSMGTTSIDLFLFASSLVATSPVGALGVRAVQSVRPPQTRWQLRSRWQFDPVASSRWPPVIPAALIPPSFLTPPSFPNFLLIYIKRLLT